MSSGKYLAVNMQFKLFKFKTDGKRMQQFRISKVHVQYMILEKYFDKIKQTYSRAKLNLDSGYKELEI